MGQKRYLYAGVGVVMMLFAGFVYAWSILSAPIAADFPQWGNAQLSLTFTICMAFFCLGGMAAGFLSKRIPVRVNAVISAALFLAGFFLTSRANGLPLLYVSYGVLCGTASGFAYNAVMNVIPRWFPGRQGLISGVLLLGFGASSMIIGSVFTAVTPEAPGAWRNTLLAMGVLMAAVIFTGSFFLVPPEGGTPSRAAAEKAEGGGRLELAPAQMLGRASFWLFFAWATLCSAAGLVVIAQARGLAAGTLSFIVGLISVCNGLGRVMFGALYDRIGRKLTMLLVAACFLAGIGLLWGALGGSLPLLTLGFVFIGLGYGGGPTMSAAVIKEFYGEKNYPVNFSIVNVNLLVASFASTAAAAVYDAVDSYAVILLGLLALALGSVACWACIRKP